MRSAPPSVLLPLLLCLAPCLALGTAVAAPGAYADEGFPPPVPAEDPPTGGPGDPGVPPSSPWPRPTDPPPNPSPPGAATPAEATLSVPSLIGLTMVEAQQRLVAMGLQPRPWFVDAPAAEPFRVVNQKLAAGTWIAPRGTVDFRVARPAVRTDRLPVPHLLGLSREEAVEVLRALGVEAMMLSRRPGEFRGLVVRQDPEPGAWMRWSEFVTFTLSGEGHDRAPEPMARTAGPVVGSVVGMTLADAERLARSVGLRPHVVRRLDADAEPGVVAEQEPQAGRPVAPGGALTLYLPQEAIAPDLRGLTLAEAEVALSAASLRSHFDPRPPASAARPVVAQRPAAGQRIAAGSVVRLLFEGDPPAGGPAWQAVEAPFGGVPDVLGVLPEEASARLKAAGFEPVLEWAPGVGPGEEVRVAGQLYPPAARRRMGSAVPLWVDRATLAPPAATPGEPEGLLEKVGGFFRRIPREVSRLPGEARKLPGVFERLGEEVKKLPGKVEDLVR